MKPTKRENWPQFLKEMQNLQPFIPQLSAGADGGSRIPILGTPTRQQARALGLKSKQELLDLRERDLAQQQAKADIIDQWFEDNLSRFLPRWYVRLGARRLWMFNLLGLYITFTNHAPKGKENPYTLTRIHFRFFKWWELAAAKHVWD